jgi:hypothetical protein
MHPVFLLLFLLPHNIFAQSITTISHKLDGIIVDMQWCGSESDSEDYVMNSIRKSENKKKNDNPLSNDDKKEENLVEDQPIYYKKKVFVLTSKGSVYFSEEEGKDFKNLEETLKMIGREKEINDKEVICLNIFVVFVF